MQLHTSGTFFKVLNNIAFKRTPTSEGPHSSIRAAPNNRRLRPETWRWPFNHGLRRCPVILMTVSTVCGKKLWADPCHRLAFLANNWFERDSAYILGHSTYFVKGQLSCEKISNTGELPRLPSLKGFANCCVNYCT